MEAGNSDTFQTGVDSAAETCPARAATKRIGHKPSMCFRNPERVL